jgi:hypothetical protein
MWRGFLVALGSIGAMSVAAYPLAHQYARNLSPTFFSDLSQVGATLFIAYALETASLVRMERARGSTEEYWLGGVCGLASCALVAIGLSLILAGHSGPLTTLELLGVCVSICAIGMQGVLVAALPFLWYGWVHAATTQYPDE